MLDIIIATYNRIEKAIDLANKSLASGSLISKVIIVDSSKDLMILDNLHPLISLVRTKHMNQPYQRYLGYLHSESSYLLFLDDDMEVIDQNIFNSIFELFQKNSQVVGINLPFDNPNRFLSSQPKSLFSSSVIFRRFFGFLNGYMIAKGNQYLYNGIKGEYISNNVIEYVSGGAFAAKRESLYKNFNMQLFTIYEAGLGKGEDGILGYTLSKQGDIISYDRHCFVHNDFNDSSYTVSQIKFAKRVMFSRLYLSCEYYRLNKKPYILGYFRFLHYFIGRFLGVSFSYILSPSNMKRQIFIGYSYALIHSLFFKFDYRLTQNSFWFDLASHEINTGHE